ncbi:hypothetical protein DUI87_30839 [Hirundo rustica rustica]|uniref:ribonuclease H n=1 Tax=Hirundo rustica rustica TaxID=333673 RepID=A0A3M0J1V8_HIRRU|nr:hypothetical protein DUI87_30839 [Hirundo rustica rustica]
MDHPSAASKCLGDLGTDTSAGKHMFVHCINRESYVHLSGAFQARRQDLLTRRFSEPSLLQVAINPVTDMEQRPPRVPKLAWLEEEEEGPGAAQAQETEEVQQFQPLQEETNLLGRDLQVQLGVGVIPKDGKMVVHIMKLTQGDIQEINPEVWATEGKYGCLDIPPIKREMQKDTPAIRVKQYPMSPEGRKGLASVIEHLLKENILEPCMSPHNTPILAIKKDEGKFRLVQDLREINKRTIARHPVVPNPYTLLSKIPREHTWFTVIDLKDAFWACPLAEECRDWFTFEWEHPDRGRKQQLRWTRLPQGYTESPNIFGQALETLLEQFSPKEGVQILQYVDDLLISGEKRKKLKISKDYLEGEEVTRKYLKTIGQTLENLRKKGYLPQTSPLDANVHNINPGDWVLIKTWTNTPLTPKFEGPYQVLLTTHTAVRTEEKGWTHITRVKGPVPPPGESPSSAPSPDETEWTVTPHPKDLKLTLKRNKR